MKIVNNTKKLGWLLLPALILSTPVFAAGPPQPGVMQNPLAQAMLLLMVLLALAIAILSSVVNSAAHVFRDKLKAQKEEEKKSAGSVTAGLLVLGLLMSLPGLAQDKAAETAVQAVADNSINGLSPLTFYIMMIVLAVEILIIIVLIYQLKWLMGIEKQAAAVAVEGEKAVKPSIGSWWERINKSIAVDKEKDIDLEHDYDGIRELDNTIPPWWKLAFIFTILFGVVYMYRYHVAKSAPLQIEEFQIAMQKGEEEKNAYLKLSANNVDENSVKLLDVAGIDAGKALFKANCVACHGPEGQGLVGPNLTDTYWLHGGNIKDVFKTIKYGVVEKGMRSWKEDFSPIQIAQLASYVKSLAGSNPAGPKAPEGTQYDDKTAGAPGDSTVAAK